MSIKWHKGPPPSVGWWPASVAECEDAIRWWDGRTWSCVAWRRDTPEIAALKAREKSGLRLRMIKWRDRPASWPKRSRT